jgi:hypothetical protein
LKNLKIINNGQRISSSFLISARIYARCNASVPEPTAIEGIPSANLYEKTFSSLSTKGPWPIHLVEKTFLRAFKAVFGIYG